jgi:hypothetical protein
MVGQLNIDTTRKIFMLEAQAPKCDRCQETMHFSQLTCQPEGLTKFPLRSLGACWSPGYGGATQSGSTRKIFIRKSRENPVVGSRGSAFHYLYHCHGTTST